MFEVVGIILATMVLTVAEPKPSHDNLEHTSTSQSKAKLACWGVVGGRSVQRHCAQQAHPRLQRPLVMTPRDTDHSPAFSHKYCHRIGTNQPCTVSEPSLPKQANSQEQGPSMTTHDANNCTTVWFPCNTWQPICKHKPNEAYWKQS